MLKQGRVKFFNDQKGFGFIIEKETNKEIFVHKTGCKNAIVQNDDVTYEEAQGKKGINAVNVQRA